MYRKFIALSAGFGIAAWVLDAALDAALFYEGSFLSLLLTDVPAHELYVRSLIMLSFLVFGLIASRQTTRIRQQKQDLSLFRRLLDESTDSIFIINPKTGAFIDANDTACETLGYDRPSLLERGVHDINPNFDDATEFQDFMQGRDRTIEGFESTHVRADGTTIPVELSASTVKIDDQTYLIAIARDITERKEREQELERQNEKLQKFASVVSHDIRNPLNVAAGQLELASEECNNEHLDEVAIAHDRMESLIEDLLALAREGQEKAEEAPVDLGGLVENCWKNVDTAEASLVSDTERTIRADRSRFVQLLENLFRNAVEHGGGDVTITVGDLGDGFYVADDGPGIPEDERGEIFDAGYSTRDEGTGFGLGIVEEIVEAHDWEIRVTQSKAGGARFEITGVEFIAD